MQIKKCVFLLLFKKKKIIQSSLHKQIKLCSYVKKKKKKFAGKLMHNYTTHNYFVIACLKSIMRGLEGFVIYIFFMK